MIFNKKIVIEYFNCINFRSKSKIIRELLAKYTPGSGRGYSDDEALKLILTKLIRDQGYMLLIIDEIFLIKIKCCLFIDFLIYFYSFSFQFFYYLLFFISAFPSKSDISQGSTI
jgi:hypothetical protein